MEWIFSLENINGVAKEFWKLTEGKTVFAFHGQMGAGKTTIITALCRERGVKDAMTSPTFSIINEYGFMETGERKKIYHIDLYRLKDEKEVVETGVEDCISSGYICMVEWPEKAPGLFDERTAHVFVEVVSTTKRRIEIKLHSSL